VDRQYVAIDLHRKRSLIVRENAQGEELGVTRIDNDPLTLASVVSEGGPNPMVAIEATYGWYWAVDVLTELGADVHLVHPSGLMWDSRRVKNDYRDCRELLDRLRLGKLPEAWIAPPEVRDLRELVRYRSKLVATRTGLKAQVKAVLAKAGLHPPVDDLWGIAGGKYLDEVQLADGATVRVESIRDVITLLNREIDMLERRTHRELKDHPGYRAIQALDGVGPVLAAVFVAEIGDVTRFVSPQALCSWAGLTKAGSPLVRWAAVEAISHMRGGPKLKSDYRRIGERRGVNIARVAVARKLLTLVYYGLRDGQIRCAARVGDVG
jgi:transposase